MLALTFSNSSFLNNHRKYTIPWQPRGRYLLYSYIICTILIQTLGYLGCLLSDFVIFVSLSTYSLKIWPELIRLLMFRKPVSDCYRSKNAFWYVWSVLLLKDTFSDKSGPVFLTIDVLAGIDSGRKRMFFHTITFLSSLTNVSWIVYAIW